MRNRKIAAALLALALLISASVTATPAGEPDRAFAQELHLPFKGKQMPAGVERTGPASDTCVQFEEEGLRITLPTGWKGEREAVGVNVPVTIQGDFEITMSFEVLKEPTATEVGDIGTRLSLGIFKKTPKVTVATVSRSMNQKKGPVFVSWASLWTDEDKPHRPVSSVTTSAKVGRLRLTRTGQSLAYTAAEGIDGEFRPLAKFEFGDENIRLIRVVGSTGGPTAYLDVRASDLRIRSGTAPKVAAPDAPAAVPPFVEGPPEVRSRGWLPIVLVAGLAGTLLLALGVGVWLLIRGGREAK